MSSSTPLLPKLLPKQDHKRSDHSMFLRVCHSPHSFISQITLRGLRGIIAFYMIGAFAAKMYYDIAVVQHGWRTVFEISNLAWLLLTCYETLGFLWTHMHLYYPKFSRDPESFTKKFKMFLSPARGNPGIMNRFLFCFFYNGATVFNPLVTIMHWFVILPHKGTDLKDMFGHDPFKTWVIVNFFIVNSVLTFFELFFLSSLRCDQPIFIHIVWGLFTGLLLTGWLYLGHWVTGEHLYFFLDWTVYEWSKIAAMVVAFISLLEAVFLANHALIMIRQTITRKRSKRRQRILP